MAFRKIRKRIRGWHLSLKAKLTLSLSAICVILFISSIISVLEYRSMSSYVSRLIADDINNINVARELVESTNTYNLGILSIIGDEEVTKLPDFDQESFMSQCDSLKKSFSDFSESSLADSVLYSYSAYMLTSLELSSVILSDFVDTRSWYFDRLQPRYNRLRSDIDAMSTAIYTDLEKNSATFERGFYRSIIPGIVAVLVGVLLVMMLLFFMIAYYADPLYKILDNLKSYRRFGKKYNYTFEGDDQLSELNQNLLEITEENQQLRNRVISLRNKLKNNQ